MKIFFPWSEIGTERFADNYRDQNIFHDVKNICIPKKSGIYAFLPFFLKKGKSFLLLLKNWN